MYRKRYTHFFSVIAVVLVLSFVMPMPSYAAVPDIVEPLASDYLISYTSYIGPVGGGKVQVWFRVTGKGYLSDIGVLTIRLYESTDNENWYWIDSFRHTDYSNMLSHNDSHHMSYVEYEGVAGRYYKAYVTIWAGNGTSGDTRYMWTPVEQAT